MGQLKDSSEEIVEVIPTEYLLNPKFWNWSMTSNHILYQNEIRAHQLFKKFENEQVDEDHIQAIKSKASELLKLS